MIEDYVPAADVEAAFRQSGLERFVYRGPVSAPFPTLREMIDSDQRLVVFGENDTSGVPWYHPAFEAVQETPYTFHTVQDFSCKPNRGGATAPIPMSSKEFGRPAVRPSYSVLNCQKLRKETGLALRSWSEALKDYLTTYRLEINEEGR